MLQRVRNVTRRVAALGLLMASAAAHELPTIYVPRDALGLPDNSRIQRLRDVNGDGVYSGAAEVTWYYDYPSGPGSSKFGPQLELVSAPDGALFVVDVHAGRIHRTYDIDGDGQVDDSGEITLFFDGLNAPQHPASIWRVSVDNSGAVWFATLAHPLFGGLNRIIRLEDRNADGDASDSGEYTVTWWPTQGNDLSYLPIGVLTGARGELYCYDDGSGPGNPTGSGVYRLEDLDGDGLFVSSGEREFVFSTAGYSGLTTPYVQCGADGSILVSNPGGAALRAEDHNQDGFFAPSETSTFVPLAPTFNIPQIQQGFGSRIYFFSSFVLYLAEDLNGNGTIELASESRALWIGGTVNPEGFTVDRGEFQPPPRPYCTAGVSPTGCVPALRASGRPSASWNSGFTLELTGAPQQRQAMIFYGLSPANTPWGSASTKCVGNPIQRAFAGATGGVSPCDGALSFDWNQYAAAHPLALGGPFRAGDTFYAQGWSRDVGANPAGLMSNGLEVRLLP